MFQTLLRALPWPAIVFDASGQLVAINDLAATQVGAQLGSAFSLAEFIGSQGWSLDPSECLALQSPLVHHQPHVTDSDQGLSVYVSRIEESEEARVLLCWDRGRQTTSPGHDQLVFQNNPDALFLTQSDGRIMQANHAACQLLGMTEQEILTAGRQGIVLQDEALARALERRDAIGQYRGDLTYLRRDGGRFIGETTSVVIGGSGTPNAALVLVRDVTEQRQTDARLSELTSRLQLATIAARAGVWDWHLPTNTMHWDDRMLELYGHTRATFRGGIEAWKQGLHPDDATRAAAECEAALRGEREFDTQFRICRPNGSTVHIKADGLVLRNEAGDAIRMIGLNRDLTEHIAAESAATERAEELSRFFDLASDMLCIIDADTTFRRVSHEWTASLGWRADELCGHSFVEFLHPEDIERSLAALRQLSDRQPILQFTNRYRCQDGSYRWVEWRAVAPGGAVVYGVARDVTDRLRQEEALRQSEQRFKGLVEAASEPIFVQTGGRFTYLNEAAVSLFGVSSVEELIGTPVLDRFHPSSREGILDRMRRINDQREAAASTVDVIGVRPDGSQFIVETSGSPVMYQGQPGAVVFARDVTDRKRLEAQLAQAQRMEAVGRLAGGIAHDFNNMLTVIIGSAELLRGGLPSTDPSRETLSDILTAARHSADLTRQLLAFAKKQTIRPQVLDLNQVLAEALKMLRRLVGEHIDLDWRPGTDVWPVHLDLGQVEQILANLVVNARDAMPNGGRIVIDTSNVRLDEAFAMKHLGGTPGEYVRLSISDTGVGMSEDVRRQVFEPFFTTKAFGAGTGLGLATVYGIVKQHGGYIDVYSEVSIGTTFKIWFPRHRSEPATMRAQADEATPQGLETVLLVEDEAALLRLAGKMLTLLGYTVVAANDGPTALALAEDYGEVIDLVMTDVVMPGMNGRELVSRLAAKRPGLKALYTSGYTANVIAHHGVLNEGVELLQKPFSLPDLAQAVRRVLDR